MLSPLSSHTVIHVLSFPLVPRHAQRASTPDSDTKPRTRGKSLSRQQGTRLLPARPAPPTTPRAARSPHRPSCATPSAPFSTKRTRPCPTRAVTRSHVVLS